MKKIKISIIIIFLASVLIFTGFCLFEKITKDTEPPVISYDESVTKFSVTADEKEFLKNVTAKDNKSGDVSDSLVVESMSEIMEDNTREISYAAIDESGNVGRKNRTIQYKDYQKPTYTLKRPLRFQIGKSIDIFSCIAADSVLDGDLSGKIKYTLSNGFRANNPGIYNIEFSVMDSGENVVYLPVTIEMYEGKDERIEVSLKQYLVYSTVGQPFDANEYYEGADKEGRLIIDSGVNTAQPGVYYVDYIVEGPGGKGVSRLVVVVMEE